jgi:hypothetical protein
VTMRCAILLLASLCVGASLHAEAPPAAGDAAKTTASGSRVSPEQAKQLEGAKAFTPAELQAQIDEHTDDLCKNSTLHARSDGKKIELDGGSYPIDDFGAELARRYKKAAFACVEIVGPGQDAGRVSRYLKALEGTDVASIGWRVEAPADKTDGAHP